MNPLPSRNFFRSAGRLAAVLAVVLVAGAGRAAAPQPARFLLIFETSPTIKKNLPEVRHIMGKLFAGNLQNEIQVNDDLAVWTVDETLHPGVFEMASWSPEDAGPYAERLFEFLDQQKYTRHASLDGIQPVLNRVVKDSDRLTVVIFCDSQSRLLGTPYDVGVNDIITNTAARVKEPVPVILVLRAQHGGYLGCSVNRSDTLNFPKFLPPPKPVPPPVVVRPAPVPPPVAPIPAMIIVGTNAGTNLADLPRPAAVAPPVHTNVPPPPAGAPPAMNILPTNAAPLPSPPAAPSPAPMPPMASAPASPPPPAPLLPPQKTSSPAPPVISAAVPPASTNPSVAVSASAANLPPAVPAPERGYLLPLAIGGAALVGAVAVVAWLMGRGRRPRSSLITSSMHDDPPRPGPK